MSANWISLAPQGDGAHGAFSLGALDRLLEDNGIEVVTMSGTSAGALNAAASSQALAPGAPVPTAALGASPP